LAWSSARLKAASAQGDAPVVEFVKDIDLAVRGSGHVKLTQCAPLAAPTALATKACGVRSLVSTNRSDFRALNHMLTMQRNRLRGPAAVNELTGIVSA
jgi:hypothetical protein